MSKLEELINELCPNGVHFVSLRDCVTYIRGKGLSKSDKGTGDNPIILYGELYTTYGDYITEIKSFASDEAVKSSVKVKKNSLLLPISSTTKEAQIGKASVLKCEEIYLGGDAICLVPNVDVLADFLMYAINGNYFEASKMKCVKGTTIQHLDPKGLLNIKIPVPPIEVQEEIVRILDNFTELTEKLTEKLTAELTARKKQYDYYNDKLMNFGEDVTILSLGDIGSVKMCKRILKEQTNTKGGIPFYKIGTFGKEPDAYITEELFDEYRTKYSYPKKGDILISCSGTIGRTVVFDGNPAYFQDSNIVWLQHDATIVNNKYLQYCYKKQPWQISTGGTISRLYNDNILKAKIPVPSLEEQERIVDILNRFDALCNDISTGLPAEIEARKKQYEYYRDKLLTFKEYKEIVE